MSADDRLAQSLNNERLDAISDLLALASRFAAAASLAAECGDLIALAVRTRQIIAPTREAALILATLGQPEPLE